MGVPSSEVGYTPAMPRVEDHEVHKDMWCGIGPKKIKTLNYNFISLARNNKCSVRMIV